MLLVQRSMVLFLMSKFNHKIIYTNQEHPKNIISKYFYKLDRKKRNKLIVANFISIFAIFGVIAIIISHAASPIPFSVITADSGVLNGGACVVNNASTTDDKAVSFGGSCCNLGLICSYPNQYNTGYEYAPGYPGNLTTYSPTANGTSCSGPITSNTTYQFCNFVGGVNVGSSTTPVTKVTFLGDDFDGNEIGNALVVLFGNNITFNYDSITPALSAPPATNTANYEYGIIADGGYYSHVGQLTVENSNIWGFGNAIDVTGSTQSGPQVYENNYIHDACYNDDTCPSLAALNHTDGIGDLNSGDTDSYVTINHNTISSLGNTNAIAYQEGPYSNFTVTNNYFSGFGYTVHIGSQGPTNSTFTGNVFATDFEPFFGPLYGGSNFETASDGNTWSDNTYYVTPGTTWMNPAVNGLYWWPSDDFGSANGQDPLHLRLMLQISLILK